MDASQQLAVVSWGHPYSKGQNKIKKSNEYPIGCSNSSAVLLDGTYIPPIYKEK